MSMQDTATGRKGVAHRGILRRLARDRKGNTLAIVGAALVPLTAMIGSGVDMSRAYMAKQRLQSACDAAALAGRRLMTNDQISDAVRNEAVRYFNFNFQQNAYQTASFTPTVTRPASGTIRVAAATRIPTTIMRLFGYTTLPLSVTCDASLNYVNTDVMLVLDTTGSMLQDVNGSATSTAADQKIAVLRDAVMALYDALKPTQTQLEAGGMRLRYGIVPYSSAVNVGGLIRSVNPSYLSDSVSYPSRVANYNTAGTPVANPSTTSSSVEIYNNGAGLSQNQCRDWGRNNGNTATGGGPAPAATTSTTYTNNQTQGVDWGYPGAALTTGTSRSCRRTATVTTTTYRVPYRFTDDTFRDVTYDTSQFKLGNAVTIAPGVDSNNQLVDFGGTVTTPGTYTLAELPTVATGVQTASVTWNGCIMERDTVSTITSSSGFAIPPAAYDLNINLIPNSNETRWRPMWPGVAHRRSAGSTSATSGTPTVSLDPSYYACPSEARRLQAFTRDTLKSYVDGLQAVGGTYHDIGMLWGGRLISNAGIFADSPDTFNNMPVSRHVIFMTDGELAPNCNTYTSYGYEQNERRVTGAGSCPNQDTRHLQRFRMVCNAIKGMNVSVWVITFGTGASLTQDMIDCASNTNQAAHSANRAQLIQRFTEIGQNIGALRLTQ
jgi:Flp pilus assembly protein TadG